MRGLDAEHEALLDALLISRERVAQSVLQYAKWQHAPPQHFGGDAPLG